MSADGPDPGVPAKEIFPTLTPAQIERIAPLGNERAFAAGEILFEAGGMNRPLMVVLEGEIEILSERDTVVTVHRPGNFSGDVDVIAGHPAVVRARARSAGRVLEVARTARAQPRRDGPGAEPDLSARVHPPAHPAHVAGARGHRPPRLRHSAGTLRCRSS